MTIFLNITLILHFKRTIISRNTCRHDTSIFNKSYCLNALNKYNKSNFKRHDAPVWIIFLSLIRPCNSKIAMVYPSRSWKVWMQCRIKAWALQAAAHVFQPAERPQKMCQCDITEILEVSLTQGSQPAERPQEKNDNPELLGCWQHP